MAIARKILTPTTTRTSTLPKIFFWFRRDLRLSDNRGFAAALAAGLPVQAVFIFDQNILAKLEDPRDRRVQFIYQQVSELKNELVELGSDLWV